LAEGISLKAVLFVCLFVCLFVRPEMRKARRCICLRLSDILWRRILGTGIEFAALFDQFLAAIFRVFSTEMQPSLPGAETCRRLCSFTCIHQRLFEQALLYCDERADRVPSRGAYLAAAEASAKCK
jgi:hypothetical protein